MTVAAPMIDVVRRFNRTVAQRVGALEDAYLSRERPLGQARVLWEIGPDGSNVSELRCGLDLDSGYLSRLLRALERDGLIEIGAAGTDGRERTASLTNAGRAEWAVLDQGSDQLARSILNPLSPGQRERLVTAMADVEWLLVASMVEITVRSPRDPQARHCLRSYLRELSDRFDGGFVPERSISARDDELTPPAGLFVVATLHSEAVGCGAMKFHPDKPAEIKRMWVASTMRGLGLGRRLLDELEHHAARAGARTVRLETNRSLTEAISLYRRSGYREVPAFNTEPYAHHWFEKEIARSLE
jgi:DNA-binding MarR family transcriptional regulator/ribosomal protein S18 acetylase RimI-like enzyme